MTITSAHPITVKLDALFNITDADQNGYLEWSDYERIVDRYLSAYKVPRGDRRALALTASYQMYWMELLRHAGGDTRLDRATFHHATRAAIYDTSRFQMIEAVPHAVFDIIDADGDGVITREEFVRHFTVWDGQTPDAHEVFVRLDTDGDGVISRHEFIRAVREFYYSPDLDAPGSVVFGVLPLP
ncbi:EF-hand domain-containing protein [Actinocorallia sp. A-T 12471]|uniref:EF-hand domain-containing protein n=1 Tax=Actinocorallia sp. A-T 12471 TaxID=3089813 RepID=UPI0029D07B0D|nr:EF-hand domain-containing protein [Actinocorallia sp. A-T 12471]MDX6743926.1 EF-hand domain-containing protein [Actinocorallia sp. A-T 12471]